MSSDIILTPVLQTPVIVLRSDVVDLAESLIVLAKDADVQDVFALAGADEIQKKQKDLIKQIESERVRVKAPFMAVCKQIDEEAGKIADKLTGSARLLGCKIVVFSREQARIRQKAETAARIERETAEAKARAEVAKIEEANRLAREVAAKANRPPPSPVMAPIARPIVMATYVPEEIKSTSTTTVKTKVLVIDEQTLIPWDIGGVTLLIPDEKAIKKLLLAGIKIPGCRIEEREAPRGL